MPYIERNETGVILALYAAPQEGIAEEWLADDAPEVRTLWGKAGLGTPLNQPLDRLTFWLVAARAGISKWTVRSHIEAMPDGPEKFEAIAWFEEARQYRRDDPLLVSLAGAAGLSEEQLDALWTQAAGG